MAPAAQSDRGGLAAPAGPVGTQAVDRAALLLVAVLDSPEPVASADLVAASGLPKSTVSRLLSSLERSGLVQRTDDGAMVPGPVIADYALSVRPEDTLVRMAQPSLDRLGALTRETVNLAIPLGGEVRQIAQVDSTYLLGAVNWLDQPVPFHCSALGRVFLAHGYPLPAGRLPRLTEHTLTSRSQLQRELDRVARQGFAVVDSELEPGLVAVAAPIRSADGSVTAAVSVSGPSVRLTPEAIPQVAAHVVEAADAISLALRPQPRHDRAGTSRKGAA